MNSYCSFCASAGIAGPHDHILRTSKALGSKLMCPKLKSIECGHCGMKGHTASYCGKRNEEKTQVRLAALEAKRANFNAGEWQVTKSSNDNQVFKSPEPTRTKTQTPSAPKLASRFGALNLEMDEQKPISNTWSMVAQGIKINKNVPEEDDEDDELPPLTWGKISTKRWGE